MIGFLGRLAGPAGGETVQWATKYSPASTSLYDVALCSCYHGVERHGICFLLPESGIERHRDRSFSILLYSAALPAIKCSFLSFMYIPFVCKSSSFFESPHGRFVIDIGKIYNGDTSCFRINQVMQPGGWSWTTTYQSKVLLGSLTFGSLEISKSYGLRLWVWSPWSFESNNFHRCKFWTVTSNGGGAES